MWKLLNKMFGYDYIYWENSCAQGIARVWRTRCGHLVYWGYRNTRVMDEIRTPEQVKWLTCSSAKYFKTNKPKERRKAWHISEVSQ